MELEENPNQKSSPSIDSRSRPNEQYARQAPYLLTTSRTRGGNDSSNRDGNGVSHPGNSNWARRVVTDTIATDRERSQLLRTISHLHKDQDTPLPTIESTEGGNGQTSTSSAFIRLDLVSPPDYRSRPRKSLDILRSRGMSLGKDSPSSLSLNNPNNASQTSISGTTTPQGKAKAAVTNTSSKLRRMSLSHLKSGRQAMMMGGGSTGSSIQGVKREGEGTSTTFPAAAKQETILTTDGKTEEGTHLQGEESIVQSTDQSSPVTLPESIGLSTHHNGISSPNTRNTTTASTAATPTFGNSWSGPAEMVESHDDSMPSRAASASLNDLLISEKGSNHQSAPREQPQVATRFNFPTFHPTPLSSPQESVRGRTTIPSIGVVAGASEINKSSIPSSSSTTIATSCAIGNENLTSSFHYDNEDFASSTPLGFTSNHHSSSHSDLPSANDSSNRTSFADQKTLNSNIRHTSGNSLENSQNLFSPTFELPSSSRSAAAHPILPLPTLVADDTDMNTVGVDNFTQQRRGSAPSENFGKRKGMFKLGMLKFGGSTVEVDRIEPYLEKRRGSHLESNRSTGTDDAEILASPTSATASSPVSQRQSFSLSRRSPSHEGIRPTPFSLFSKMNKSKDQLQVVTLDAEEERSLNMRKRTKSEVSSAAKQFIANALRRSSRSSISTVGTDRAPPSTLGQNGTRMVDTSQDVTISEDGDQALATAFGAPQKVNAQLTQEFEGQERATNSAVDDELAASSQRNKERNHSSWRNSQESSSTSFFSIAESSGQVESISRFPGLYSSSSISPFDQTQDSNRKNRVQDVALRQSVAHAPAQEDEGPLGEQRQQLPKNPQTDELPTHLALGLNIQNLNPKKITGTGSLNQTAEQSPFSSPSDQGSTMTHQTRSTAPSSWIHPSELASTSSIHLERASAPVLESVKGKRVEDESNRRTEQVDIRRPSMGIDEEQDELDRQRVMDDENVDQGRTTEVTESDEQGNRRNNNGESNGNTRRPNHSSRLSQLPRLNSMRIGAGSGRGGGGGSDDDENEGNDDRRTTRQPEDVHSDSDTGEEVQEEEEGEESEMETDTGSDGTVDTDADQSGFSIPGSMPVERRVPSATASSPTTTTSSLIRQRPGDIQLPPAPSFGQTSTTDSTTPLIDDQSFAIGQHTWTQFSAASPSETPRIFATPKPRSNLDAATTTNAASSSSQRPSNPVTNSNQTPKTLTESVADNSYFNIPPAPRTKVNSSMPPPSPSIITRSRAPSSASMRSMRSPIRELPPLPPITPLQFRALDSSKSMKKSTSTSASVAGVSKVSSSGTSNEVPSSPPPSFSRHNLPPYVKSGRPTSSRTVLEQSSLQGKGGADFNSILSNTTSAKLKSSRPGLYQQQSRSLIDLNSAAARNLKEPIQSPSLFPSKDLQRKDNVDSGLESGFQSPPSTEASTPGGLKRRRSMFEVGAQPPPYVVIHKRPEGPQFIFPREEEGKELLPKYSCSVHIEGYLPRKMEFSSPGVQAKDRSWRRQYFVLHGTCLKVFKHDMSGDNMIGKGAWGNTDEGVHVHKEPMNEDGPLVPIANASSSGKEGAVQNGNHNNHSSGLGGGLSGGGGATGSSSLGAAKDAVSALTGTIYNSNKSALVKTYSLQGAESGLAADYLKRRHVVRVRVEGEQFLLQTRNDRHVVDWIEAFQAATNISLDLESRTMPKFITLPRRRRRRRREGGTEAADASNENREAADVAEAQRRSMTETRGNANDSRARLPPVRPLGLPGDESPNPSAAFDDMLREEHAHMMQTEASDI